MNFGDVKSRAHDAVELAVKHASSAAYERVLHLRRILPLGPDEIADMSDAGRRKVLAKLTKALRAERARGRAGHWTYDLNRHLALLQAYAAESRTYKYPG